MSPAHPGSADRGFGDQAAEMANETEVEATFPAREGASAPAEDAARADEAGPVDGAGPVDAAEAVDRPVDEGAGAPASGEEDARAWPDGADDSGAGEVDDDLAAARADLADLTGHLQRLQAEFLNYKKRVERDRQLIAENATYKVLTPIIDVLDTIDRAREHGDLDPGFRAVAEQLERVVGGLGLTRFGEVGDVFDPTLHEALSHLGTDPEVSEPTCKVVAKAGYRIGDRVVRAAQVLVVDPAEG